MIFIFTYVQTITFNLSPLIYIKIYYYIKKIIQEILWKKKEFLLKWLRLWLCALLFNYI